VDGASHLRIFRSTVLPLSMPAIASFGILQFLWVWNDLLVAKTFGGTSPERRRSPRGCRPRWAAMERTGTCWRLLGSSRSSSR
jgi:ABC-type glycerol-3-phosphate transport system permease component